MNKNNDIQFHLLSVSEALKPLLQHQAIESTNDAKSLMTLNRQGIELLKSKQKGEWFQLIKTIYHPNVLAAKLSQAGFIVLALNHAIFVFAEPKQKNELESKLRLFFNQSNK